MRYLSVKEAAEKWNITPRRVQVLCSQGKVEGANKVGNMWVIPETAKKPIDARAKFDIVEKSSIRNNNIFFERVWAMPNKNTFEIKPIRELIRDEVDMNLLWIDPFANRNKYATITNDLNTKYDTDYHMDALDFLKLFDDESVDGVLYDPPYSPRQVSECYNDVGYNVTWDTTKASFWGNHKREISRIVKKGGKVITFGWNSGGIGNKHGFTISRILLVPHGGWHNDTICTVEVKTHDGVLQKAHNQMTLDDFINNEKFEPNSIDKKIIEYLKKLPPDYWDFKNEDVKEFTHGIHNYPAMMVAPISRNIIKFMKNFVSIKSVLDPFVGSGTVLVESMLAGIHTIAGSDINPLALFLTKVKTTPLNIEELQSVVSELNYRIKLNLINYGEQISNVDNYFQNELGLDLTSKDGWGKDAPKYLLQYCNDNNILLEVPNFKNIGYWFKPKVILELSIIKSEILKIKDTNIRNFVFAALSESIRLVSNRRNGEFKMFRMTPAKVLNHNPDVFEEFSKIVSRNIKKMCAFVEAYNESGFDSNVTIYNNNACSLEDVPNNEFDLIITSPPYGDSKTTVAYGEYSRLSLQWMNLFNLTESQIMGLDKSLMGGKKYNNGFELTLNSQTLRNSLEKIKDIDLHRAGEVFSFYSDLAMSIKNIAEKTKIGGYQFWVIGNRTVKGELLQTDIIITELAKEYGMEHIYTVNRNIPNKVMPSQNSPTNESGKKSNTMTMEHIVVLRKA